MTRPKFKIGKENPLYDFNVKYFNANNEEVDSETIKACDIKHAREKASTSKKFYHPNVEYNTVEQA